MWREMDEKVTWVNEVGHVVKCVVRRVVRGVDTCTGFALETETKSSIQGFKVIFCPEYIFLVSL